MRASIVIFTRSKTQNNAKHLNILRGKPGKTTTKKKKSVLQSTTRGRLKNVTLLSAAKIFNRNFDYFHNFPPLLIFSSVLLVGWVIRWSRFVVFPPHVSLMSSSLFSVTHWTDARFLMFWWSSRAKYKSCSKSCNSSTPSRTIPSQYSIREDGMLPWWCFGWWRWWCLNQGERNRSSRVYSIEQHQRKDRKANQRATSSKRRR